MSIELKVPAVGESISQVEIGDWLKKEGDFVERDDEVVTIETDKATLEVPAPESGTITKILKSSGQTASVDEIIAFLEPSERPPARGSPAKPTDPETRKVTEHPLESAAVSSNTSGRHGEGKISLPESGSVNPPSPQHATGRSDRSDRIETQASEFMQAAADEGVTETVPEQETFPQRKAPAAQPLSTGRVNARESMIVEADASGRIEPSPLAQRTVPRQGQSADGRSEEIAAMSHLRRRVAERLVEAQRSAALLSTFNEVDMSSIIQLRERYGEAFRQHHQTRLGFMSFFVKATIAALRLIPEVNAEIRGSNIVYRHYYDIGVAVGGGKGLVVPVLRNAERLSFAAIEQAIADFARRAEQNKLTPVELQGGTFTISNGGIYGSLLSTPIVNPPQSGILGLHAIQQRPVARDGAVVIRPMMYVALTYDHRLIDGREAVTFLKHVKDIIEDPARLLFEI